MVPIPISLTSYLQPPFFLLGILFPYVFVLACAGIVLGCVFERAKARFVIVGSAAYWICAFVLAVYFRSAAAFWSMFLVFFAEVTYFDLVVSNETLCELDRNGLEMALREFFRVLKSGGQMVHGELIQAFENEAQRLVIEANLHSLETSLPRPEWVSPPSDKVAALLRKIGFQDIAVRYFETNVKFHGSSVALKKLRQWHVDPVFIKERLRDIKRYGLEYPMEHLIFRRK